MKQVTGPGNKRNTKRASEGRKKKRSPRATGSKFLPATRSPATRSTDLAQAFKNVSASIHDYFSERKLSSGSERKLSTSSARKSDASFEKKTDTNSGSKSERHLDHLIQILEMVSPLPRWVTQRITRQTSSEKIIYATILLTSCISLIALQQVALTTRARKALFAAYSAWNFGHQA